ncbi:MAG TPA: hypothetical protein VD794_08430 [Flavisolibacter sp.]|nr:hypothetical protein [Flavisolibacter sp.]
MAKQAGPLFFTGTIGDVILYKVGDSYYARMKGSYNTKALQKPGARPLMQLRQQEFGQASKLAKEVYWRQLPRESRGRGVHGQLTRLARQLLRAGKSDAEVKTMLVPLYLGKTIEATTPAEATVQAPLPEALAKSPVDEAAMPERTKDAVRRATTKALPGFKRQAVVAGAVSLNGLMHLKTSLPPCSEPMLAIPIVPYSRAKELGSG